MADGRHFEKTVKSP